MDLDSFLCSVLQNSSYESLVDIPSLPQTNEPIWFLGRKYVLPTDRKDLEDDVTTRFWFTYRKNFYPIGGNGPTSDQGWGCMLRCGQMMFGHALTCCHLGRNYRWHSQKEETQDGNSQKFGKILRLFLDERDHTYSIHQIASMGESLGRAIGEWFGPSTIITVLRKLSSYDKWGNVTIYCCMDAVIIANEIVSHCKKPIEISQDQKAKDKPESAIKIDDINGHSDADDSDWKPLLLVIPLRLGISDVNPIYYDQLKACFRLEQSIGVLGGKPSHAFWFVGYTEDYLLYFDPHTTQARVDPSTTSKLHDTFHVRCPSHTNIKELDPSMALGFLCNTEADFRQLCQSLKSEVLGQSTNPICEIYSTRPSHLKDIYSHHSPKEATGDADDVDKHYYEEFEII